MREAQAKMFAAALVFTGLAATATPADAAVRAGVLTCRSGPSVGLILGSVRRFTCAFRPSTPGPSYAYSASVGRIGVDIGVTAGSQLAWVVFAPTARLGPGDLAGTYVGGSAAIALGLGAGANALIGGSANSVALQPLSLEGQIGINVAAGAEGLTLTPAR